MCLFEELPKFTVVVLSENDFIVDSKKVREWLSSFPESNEYKGEVKSQLDKVVKTIYSDKTYDHGHILINN